MNQFVEDYLEALVEDALAAAGGTATVYKGTSGEVGEPDEHAILCLCDELEGVVGPLRLAKVKIVVRTPALTGDRAAHSALARTVSEVFLGELPPAIDYFIADLTINGHHVTGQSTGQGENNTWLTAIEATLGVELLGSSPFA